MTEGTAKVVRMGRGVVGVSWRLMRYNAPLKEWQAIPLSATDDSPAEYDNIAEAMEALAKVRRTSGYAFTRMESVVWREDDEEFCPDCHAGMLSPEHHQKCIVPERVRAEGVG